MSGEQDVKIDKVLSWSAATDPNITSVLGYTIYIDPNENFVGDGLALVEYFDNAIPATQTDFTPNPELAYNETYFWRVTAEVQYNFKAPGDTNDISSPLWNFTTTDGLPTISVQPKDTTVAAGNSADFSVTADNYVLIEWYKDGDVTILDTGETLTIPSTIQVDEGFYCCVLTSLGGQY